MAELIWTTEAPTEPGWYWLRTKWGAGRIRKVEMVGERLLVVGGRSTESVMLMDYVQFAGPIPAPKEADRGPSQADAEGTTARYGIVEGVWG